MTVRELIQELLGFSLENIVVIEYCAGDTFKVQRAFLGEHTYQDTINDINYSEDAVIIR